MQLKVKTTSGIYEKQEMVMTPCYHNHGCVGKRQSLVVLIKGKKKKGKKIPPQTEEISSNAANKVNWIFLCLGFCWYECTSCSKPSTMARWIECLK